jgi:hypothetical protein
MIKLFPKDAALDDKIQHLILIFLRLSLVTAMAVAVTLSQWEIIFFAASALLLSYVPRLIERNYRIDLPIEYEVVLVLFVYAAIFLGEAESFYFRFWWWDLMLHALSGVILAFAAFLVLYILYMQQRLSAKPLILSLFAFSFSLAIGTLWEIFEFSMDEIFGTNMQKSGLRDTMSDLIVDAGGALVVAALGYHFLMQGQRHKGLIAQFIENFLNNNPHLTGKNSGKR